MTMDTKQIEREATCSAFNVIVRTKLPKSYVNARLVNLVGESTTVITFAIKQKEQWVNGIIENDPLFFKVLVQQDEKNGTWVIESNYFPVRALKSIGLTFRKLRASSEWGVILKLQDWMLKNAEYLKLLGDY
jgi:hypothetical protein